MRFSFPIRSVGRKHLAFSEYAVNQALSDSIE
jgi:hypothetical protein